MRNFFRFDIRTLKIIIFYLALFFLITAISIKYNNLDFDLWARLIMGNHVFYKGYPMFSDVVSYTPTHIWYDPEWLFSAFLYFVRIKFGVIGLTFLKIILIFFCFVVISLAIKDRISKNVPFNNFGFYFVLLLIAFQASIMSYTVRCQLITFLLMAVWIFILEKVRRKNDELLYILPFIMLFWLNCHGGCIAGVGILFLYGIGEFLNKKPCKKYFIALFFVCLVFLINPWGVDYIKFIIESSYLDRSWIAEWQSPFATSIKFHLFYKVFLICSFLCYGYKIYLKKLNYELIDKTKLIILIILAFLSIKYVKHSGLFIVVYSIFLYEDFYFIYNYLMDKLRKYLQLNDIVSRYLTYFKEIFIYFLVYIYSFFVILTVPVKYSYFASTLANYPVQPLRFLELNNIEGRIFSAFYNGSFIAYKYYPKLKIFMDGRQEQVYSSEIFDESMFFLNWLGNYPESAITRIRPDIILVEKSWRCVEHLEKNPDFKRVYSDNKYNIYLRNNIQKFSYMYPDNDFENYFNNLFDTVFDYSKVKNR